MRIQQCPENALAGLYQHCEAVICPSFYEGSGVTALEAMRAGAQLVAGRVGAIPEFAGNAPISAIPRARQTWPRPSSALWTSNPRNANAALYI